MYADDVVKDVKYLSEDDLLIGPKDVEYATKIPSTLEVHKVKLVFNEDGVCKKDGVCIL